jgi:hypothetical protein
LDLVRAGGGGFSIPPWLVEAKARVCPVVAALGRGFQVEEVVVKRTSCTIPQWGCADRALAPEPAG